MSFNNDAVDWITGEISAISLHTADPGTPGGTSATNEITGGGYARLAPVYATATGGSADLTATLEYDGPANGGPVTHIAFWRGTTFWQKRQVGTSRPFNSDGRLNLSSAQISASVTA